jgi:hypothetical protein
MTDNAINGLLSTQYHALRTRRRGNDSAALGRDNNGIVGIGILTVVDTIAGADRFVGYCIVGIAAGETKALLRRTAHFVAVG